MFNDTNIKFIVKCGFGNRQYYYRPQTKVQEGNVFTHVCLFIGSLPSHNAMGQADPSLARRQIPSQGADSAPQDTVKKWAVRILLECTLVLMLLFSFLNIYSVIVYQTQITCTLHSFNFKVQTNLGFSNSSDFRPIR